MNNKLTPKQWVKALRGKNVFLKNSAGEKVLLTSSVSDGAILLDGKEIFGKEYTTTFDYLDTLDTMVSH